MSMADDIIDGIFCEDCQQYVGNSVGHPRKCEECKPQRKQTRKRKSNKRDVRTN